MHFCLQLIHRFILIHFLLTISIKSDGSMATDGGETIEQNFVRYRRQLLDDEAILADPERRQLDLNQSVPFIFSARLYPFGVKKGDSEIIGDVGEWTLPRPMLFLENAYDTIWVHRNGLISMVPNFDTSPKPFPLTTPLIAAFWTEKSVLTQRRRVLIREINEGGTLALAQSEVNIQFRYGSDFAPEAIILITWIEAEEDEEQPEEADVLIQLALILGKNACFAHLIFSKMSPSATNAISGFNGANSANDTDDDATNKSPKYFMLPGSGTSSSDESLQLSEKSNIGIPGEWLMRIDEEQIHLCGAGFQGIECVDSCLPTQWYLDCSRTCHCAEGAACNIETGECPDGKCNPGWKGSPICDEDIDECTDESISCPDEQPDCMNTPGAYLCFCFEYDNSTGTCIGSSSSSAEDNKETARKSSDRFAVPVASMALVPKLGPQVPKTSKIPPKIRQNLPEAVTRPVAPKLLLKLPTATKPINAQPDNSLHRHHSASAAVPPMQHSAGSQSAETCTGCDPHAQCVQEKCQCAVGWSGNGKQCSDIDECALNSTICGVKAECQNIDGSYQCICNAGFVATQNGDGCIDVDECEESVSTTRFSPSSPQPDICPQPNSVCKNAIGGFVCECRTGYMGNPATPEGCADVDECALAEYYCGNFANCTNLPGSFRCDCHDGYEKIPNSNHCRDIDECQFKNACHKAATCTNLEGEFHCECVEGFVGDGLECHETILFPSKRKSPLISHGKTTLNTSIHLDTPLKLFGQIYSNIYISRNGIITFDHPINDSAPIDDVVRSHNAAILPLYSKYDKNGSLEIQHFDENSHNAKGPFSRSSLIIQQHFHIPDFRPKWILVVTWREMNDVLAIKKDKSNTFQAILVDGINGTFAIFLYENIQIVDEKQYFAAILHPSDDLTSEIPTELLVTRSNVGQPGKWVFRIDEHKIRTCPSGTQDPPFCQQDCDPGTFGLDCMGKCHCASGLPCDFVSGHCPAGKCAAGYKGRSCDEDIDECERGIHRCHADANCTNLVGSYSCTCQLHFYGDGFNCSKMNACLLRSNMKCAVNAHCDESNAEMPECICNDGFHGDGRRSCEPFVPTTTTTTSTTTTIPTTSTIIRQTTITVTDEQISRSLATKTTSIDRSTTSSISLAENHDDLVGAANESKLLMVIVCTVIGAVWLVVVGLFALIYCIKRYRRIHHHEYSPQMLNWIQTRTATRNMNNNNNGARSVGGTYQLSTTKYF